MAQKTITMLVDDLDNTQIINGNGQTVRFGLDGKDYELDLTNEHADELRAAFDRYVKAARNVGGRRSARNRGTTTRSTTNVDSRAVREWARANKVELSARGRIPRSVVDQFRAAGN
ncbi:MAG TPA: Lsr2 family protein [Blastococcus sp.]|nr:Lsr2 family protein [Blastococcus sp.]